MAVINVHEDYYLLKPSCKDVFEEINKLVNDGNICIHGKYILVEILVVGDYKVYIFHNCGVKNNLMSTCMYLFQHSLLPSPVSFPGAGH